MDVTIIGGGIVGTAAAAFLAEAGASVTLFERAQIGAGASGRNSGAVQHPFDPVLYRLHAESLSLYRALAAHDHRFRFPPVPAGLLLLTDDLAAAHRRADDLAVAFPELVPAVLDEAALRDEEPTLAPGWVGVRLATGYPLPPDAAVAAFAARARGAGARIREGLTARPLLRGDRCGGVRLGGGGEVAAGEVLVAAGAWSAELVAPSGGWRPFAPTHGVTLQVVLGAAPRHILEEGVVHTVNQPVEAPGEHAAEGSDPESVFSLVSAGRVSTLGSTFLPSAPDPERVAPLLVERGSRFVPGLRDAPVRTARVCVRPQSLDGLPLAGRVAGRERLSIAAGHGPWGISTGPASARLVADLILGRDPRPLPELDPRRFGVPG